MATINGQKGLISGGIVVKYGTSSRNMVQRLETANLPDFFFYDKTAIPAINCGIVEGSSLNDEVAAITALRDVGGVNRLAVTLDNSAITPAAPTAVSVGVANTAVLAASTTRKKVILCNTSAANISLGFGGNNAVLLSGITLSPNGVIILDGVEAKMEIEGIASAAASNLGAQTYT